MISKQWRVVCALVVVFLSACGGGGGGDDSKIALTFDDARLEHTFFEHQEIYVNSETNPEVTIGLTAEGEASGPIYVQVVDSSEAFVGQATVIVSEGGGRFAATLRANADLAPGQYSGTLTVNLCQDANCADKYSVTGNRLPYSITVVPQLSISVFVDGVQVATATSSSDVITLPYTPRTSIEIVSNSPMNIDAEDQPGAYTFEVDPTSTSQDWRALIDTTSGLHPGTFVDVKAGDGTGDVQRTILLYFSFDSF